MKLVKSLLALSVAGLTLAGTASAKEKAPKAAKTQAECEKQGGKWENKKCVKGDAANDVKKEGEVAPGAEEVAK